MALTTHCFKLARDYFGVGNPSEARAIALKALKVPLQMWLVESNVLFFVLGLFPNRRFGMWLRRIAVRFVNGTNIYPYVCD